VDSVSRASRILCIVPSYILICILGLETIIRYKYSKIILTLLSILALINFASFLQYYWFTYPKFTENIFGNMTRNDSYQIFAAQTKIYKLPHYVDSDALEGFFDSINFDTPSIVLDSQDVPPRPAIYMSTHSDIPGFQKLDVKMPHFNIFVRP
ncbi:MAG: hypothetical protein WC503_06385, partial [Candidatus Shapirobacteria bacterium]